MSALVTFAYGGIVFGGANWKRLAFYSNSANSRDSSKVTCALGLKGNDLTGEDVDAYMQDILVRLRKTNLSFSIVRGITRAELIGSTAGTVDANGNILVTYASGYLLTDDDIGQSAQFEVETSPGVFEVAGSFQIVGYEGIAPNFLISEPVWVDGVSNFFNPVDFLGQTVRVRFGTAQYVVSQEQKIDGVGFIPSAAQTGDSDDTKNSRRIVFDGNWQVTANTLHPDAEYRFNVSVTEQFETSGTGVIVFQGVVTAGRDTNGDKILSRDMLAIAMTQFIANTEAEVAPGGTFENAITPTVTYDEFQNALSFTYVKRRLVYPDIEGVINDPRISNANIGMVRNYATEHGLSGTNSPPSVQITYSCDIKAFAPDEVTPDAIQQFWVQDLKRYLIDTVRTVYKAQNITILAARDLAYSPTGSTLAADITVLLTGTTSSVLFYDRLNVASFNPGVEDLKANDGRDHSYAEMDRGASCTGQTIIIVVSQENFQAGPVNPSITIGSGQQFGILGGSETLSVRLVSSAQSSASNTDGQYETIVEPGDPNSLLGSQLVPEGEWRYRGTTATRRIKYHRDLDGVGNQLRIVTSEFRSSYIWRTNEALPSSSAVEEGSIRFGSDETVARAPGTP